MPEAEIQNNPSQYYGRVVREAYLEPEKDRLILSLEGGDALSLGDFAGICCELRYLTCDDDPSILNGGNLLKIEVLKVTEDDMKGRDYSEVAFLRVTTSKGSITLETHNEHNGNYSGFYLRVREITKGLAEEV